MPNPAQTHHEIHRLLKARWSPRAFSHQPIENNKILSLFEAARWSPSGGNKQPWAFIVIQRTDEETHQKLVDILSGRNKLWAGDAPILVLAVALLNPQGGASNRFAYYDVGQAVAHLSVQAEALGLHVHQMAGFDADKARALFDLPDGSEPMTLTAIGYDGDADALPDELREREVAPRARKSISEFVFGQRWGKPFHIAHTPDA